MASYVLIPVCRFPYQRLNAVRLVFLAALLLEGASLNFTIWTLSESMLTPNFVSEDSLLCVKAS